MMSEPKCFALYRCVDLDCLREFESDVLPQTFLGSPLCPECAVALEVLLNELSERGVKVSLSLGNDN